MLPTPLEQQFQQYFAHGAANPTALSMLHLLRRDASQCFGYDPNTYDVRLNPAITASPKVLFPGVMTIFAGMDLVAKFFAGSELEQTPAGTAPADQWKFASGPRLKKFAEQYICGNAVDAETLYQLRCALDHSFSLWAQRRNNGMVYSFVLADPDPAHPNTVLRTRVGTLGETEAIIYVYELHKKFQESLLSFEGAYYAQLDSTPGDLPIFQGLLDHYGFMGIAQASAFGW